MTINIDWQNRIINVNKVDMVLVQTVPFKIYKLDLDVFRLALKKIEASDVGVSFDKTHKHNTTVLVGGVTLARVIQFVNGYTITFEDESYRVEAVGANSDISSFINHNQVSVSTSNSAGLITLSSSGNSGSFNGEIDDSKTSIVGNMDFGTLTSIDSDINSDILLGVIEDSEEIEGSISVESLVGIIEDDENDFVGVL